jgi:hypothetical protein
MAELKTKHNDGDVGAFLDAIEDDRKRADAVRINDLMAEVTGTRGAMWGDSIVGFGTYRYRYASGRQGEWFKVGFSPRKQNLTLYIMSGFDHFDDLLGRLGRYSTGKSCLYVKRLEDVDVDVLRQLVAESVAHIDATHGV